ncbi:hypothetical protein AGMMS49593_10450 [Endomicrobiia bacterium]|nr:hypothetical protein AGMMS49593_10450 [Endomicrobiia bacterium]
MAGRASIRASRSVRFGVEVEVGAEAGFEVKVEVGVMVEVEVGAEAGFEVEVEVKSLLLSSIVFL